MLDAANGQLAFESIGVTISPTLTRDAFLATTWGAAAEHWVTNEPWHSWRLAEVAPSNGIDLIVVLFFHEQTLRSVELCHSDPKFGTSWEDHSMEKEMARKDSHDAWLAACIGEARKFDWGEVFSAYDQKAGNSGIVIKYVEGAE